MYQTMQAWQVFPCWLSPHHWWVPLVIRINQVPKWRKKKKNLSSLWPLLGVGFPPKSTGWLWPQDCSLDPTSLVFLLTELEVTQKSILRRETKPLPMFSENRIHWHWPFNWIYTHLLNFNEVVLHNEEWLSGTLLSRWKTLGDAEQFVFAATESSAME